MIFMIKNIVNVVVNFKIQKVETFLVVIKKSNKCYKKSKPRKFLVFNFLRTIDL